ncbi:MAG: hypothetical protein J1G06_08660 [Oscillospiraceae bacterium]|nr:hypothetical protein [Oscillospiraceae bacterium]
MTQFRVSKALIKAGVSEAEQHIIFGECMKKKTPEEVERIKQLCEAVGGQWSKALYRFLTDMYINHIYICMEYGIPRETLFDLKRRFYIEWSKNKTIRRRI